MALQFTDTIINLTAVYATAEQAAAGVRDLPKEEMETLQRELTFSATDLVSAGAYAPTFVHDRALRIITEHVIPRVAERAVALLAKKGCPARPLDALWMLKPEVAASGLAAMIDGPAYLMPELERELRRVGVTPCYALTDEEGEHKGFFFVTT